MQYFHKWWKVIRVVPDSNTGYRILTPMWGMWYMWCRFNLMITIIYIVTTILFAWCGSIISSLHTSHAAHALPASPLLLVNVYSLLDKMITSRPLFSTWFVNYPTVHELPIKLTILNMLSDIPILLTGVKGIQKKQSYFAKLNLIWRF